MRAGEDGYFYCVASRIAFRARSADTLSTSGISCAIYPDGQHLYFARAPRESEHWGAGDGRARLLLVEYLLWL